MKKLVYLFFSAIAIIGMVACNKERTYADQVKTERSAINKYLADSSVNVISEAQFALQNYTTDVKKNEFVLFNSSGVYMQIKRAGTGEKLKSGESATLLLRYTERNLLTDTVTASNMLWSAFYYMPDQVAVTNNSGTFNGYFISGKSSLMTIYATSSTAVPSGWLVPLNYINLGRQNDDTELAYVRLIVPHDKGTSYASLNVVPCLYDIIYNRDR